MDLLHENACCHKREITVKEKKNCLFSQMLTTLVRAEKKRDIYIFAKKNNILKRCREVLK